MKCRIPRGRVSPGRAWATPFRSSPPPLSWRPVTTSDNMPWIYAGRALRSFSTAFLTVVFPLYLAQSGLHASQVGAVLSLAAMLNIALVAGVGMVADRIGRRTVLIALSILTSAAAIGLGLAPAGMAVAVLTSGLGGVGRGGGAGSGGAWGPVMPVEQPLVAAAAGGDITRAFGRLSFIGVMASAAGSLVAAVPAALLRSGVPLAEGYRILFLGSGLLSLGVAAVSLRIRETPTRSEGATEDGQPVLPVRTLLGRLGLTNAINGLGFGFLGPLLTYWFYVKFGVGAAQLAVLYTLVNLVTAFPYLESGRLVERLGKVRTVVVTRVAGVGALVAMAFMPTFLGAGVMYALRMALNSLGMPARQSFSMAAAEARYRSRVAAFGNLPSQVTSMVSPALGGAVMEEIVNFPLYGASFFMLANAVAYFLAFRNAERPDHPEAVPAADPPE